MFGIRFTYNVELGYQPVVGGKQHGYDHQKNSMGCSNIKLDDSMHDRSTNNLHQLYAAIPSKILYLIPQALFQFTGYTAGQIFFVNEVVRFTLRPLEAVWPGAMLGLDLTCSGGAFSNHSSPDHGNLRPPWFNGSNPHHMDEPASIYDTLPANPGTYTCSFLRTLTDAQHYQGIGARSFVVQARTNFLLTHEDLDTDTHLFVRQGFTIGLKVRPRIVPVDGAVTIALNPAMGTFTAYIFTWEAGDMTSRNLTYVAPSESSEVSVGAWVSGVDARRFRFDPVTISVIDSYSFLVVTPDSMYVNEATQFLISVPVPVVDVVLSATLTVGALTTQLSWKFDTQTTDYAFPFQSGMITGEVVKLNNFTISGQNETNFALPPVKQFSILSRSTFTFVSDYKEITLGTAITFSLKPAAAPTRGAVTLHFNVTGGTTNTTEVTWGQGDVFRLVSLFSTSPTGSTISYAISGPSSWQYNLPSQRNYTAKLRAGRLVFQGVPTDLYLDQTVTIWIQPTLPPLVSITLTLSVNGGTLTTNVITFPPGSLGNQSFTVPAGCNPSLLILTQTLSSFPFGEMEPISINVIVPPPTTLASQIEAQASYSLTFPSPPRFVNWNSNGGSAINLIGSGVVTFAGTTGSYVDLLANEDTGLQPISPNVFASAVNSITIWTKTSVPFTTNTLDKHPPWLECGIGVPKIGNVVLAHQLNGAELLWYDSLGTVCQCASTPAANVIMIGQWQFISATIDISPSGGYMGKLFVDGSLVCSIPCAFPFSPDPRTKCELGRSATSTYGAHAGQMAAFRIYGGKALSNDEIVLLSGAPPTTIPTPLSFSTVGLAPFSPRTWSSQVSFQSAFWVIGGQLSSAPTFSNEVWKWVSPSVSWSLQTKPITWSARSGAASCVHNGFLHLIGGSTGYQTAKTDVHRFDGTTWYQVTTAAPFSARYGHTATSFNNLLVITAGLDGTTNAPVTDVWISFNGTTWNQTASAKTVLASGQQHGSVVLGGLRWLPGGNTYSGPPSNTFGVSLGNKYPNSKAVPFGMSEMVNQRYYSIPYGVQNTVKTNLYAATGRELYSYNDASNTYSYLGSLPRSIACPKTPFVVGSRLLMVQGCANADLNLVMWEGVTLNPIRIGFIAEPNATASTPINSLAYLMSVEFTPSVQLAQGDTITMVLPAGFSIRAAGAILNSTLPIRILLGTAPTASRWSVSYSPSNRSLTFLLVHPDGWPTNLLFSGGLGPSMNSPYRDQDGFILPAGSISVGSAILGTNVLLNSVAGIVSGLTPIPLFRTWSVTSTPKQLHIGYSVDVTFTPTSQLLSLITLQLSLATSDQPTNNISSTTLSFSPCASGAQTITLIGSSTPGTLRVTFAVTGASAFIWQPPATISIDIVSQWTTTATDVPISVWSGQPDIGITLTPIGSTQLGATITATLVNSSNTAVHLGTSVAFLLQPNALTPITNTFIAPSTGVVARLVWTVDRPTDFSPPVYPTTLNVKQYPVGFFGPNLTPCTCNPIGSTCSQGYVGDGSCTCIGAYTGSTCTDCKPNFYGATCTACPSCRIGSSSCSDGAIGTGKCICATGWSGTLCNTCASSFYGSTCAPCPPCQYGRCRDTITGDGSCACMTGWYGPLCDAYQPGTLLPLSGNGFTQEAAKILLVLNATVTDPLYQVYLSALPDGGILYQYTSGTSYTKVVVNKAITDPAYRVIFDPLTLGASIDQTTSFTFRVGNPNVGAPVATSAYATVSITVKHINKPPVITIALSAVKATQNGVGGATSLWLSGAIGGSTKFKVTDPDAGSNSLQLTMDCSHGSWSWNGGDARYAIWTTDATSNRHWIFQAPPGTLTVIMNLLVYTPDFMYVGPDAINLAVDDLGRTGIGGSGTVTFTIGVEVQRVNQPISVIALNASGDGRFSGIEDQPLTIGLEVSDFDSFLQPILVELSVQSGLLSLPLYSPTIKF